ncbi:MAG TPA: hypothetical protein DCE14_05055 [Kosmotogaceae bacterium]|nr:hypothetical protein [Kosmotogaceae bacterium]
MRFKIAIVGSGRKEPALESEEGQELIAKLCEGPVMASEVSQGLVEKFKKVGAVREEDGKYYLNFTCFTSRDIEILNDVCDDMGKELAQKIVERCSLDAVSGLSYGEVEWSKYLFFVVGCVCLDWYGLRVLDELGLTLPENKKEKPGYGDYYLFANEEVPRNLERLYWGSHNWKYGSFWFTTFGDHANLRNAFPDISWRLSFFSSDDIVSTVSRQMVEGYMKKLSRIIVERSWKNTEYEKVLEKLKYVKEDKLNVPVVLKRDLGKLRPLIMDVTSVTIEWAKNRSASFRKDFKDLTSVRAGVDFREVMIQVWHYIFGHANKHLTEDQRFFDPYSNESSFRGYLPVIHESGCFF